MSVDDDCSVIWSEYYREFPCFREQTVREGCQPRKLLHERGTKKAVVLVHGLTDSPFYLLDIARYFHLSLGYDVYLPLLDGHGLQHPGKMLGVSLAKWKKNVRFAIQTATEKADSVSIGGLSTGGTLAVYFAGTDPAITGELYLFSAALGIYGGPYGIFGGLLEFLLCTPFIRFFDINSPLVGKHPYRYDRVPLHSAAELVKLIAETDRLLKSPDDPVTAKRIFAAWTDFDLVVNVSKLRRLCDLLKNSRIVSFSIPKLARVEHAGLVLKEPIYPKDRKPGDVPLEAANPRFAEMMAALGRFEAGA